MAVLDWKLPPSLDNQDRSLGQTDAEMVEAKEAFDVHFKDSDVLLSLLRYQGETPSEDGHSFRDTGLRRSVLLYFGFYELRTTLGNGNFKVRRFYCKEPI